jgi:acetyl-CoA C-acetyltransferase
MNPRIIAARRSAVCPSGGAFAALSIEDIASPVIAAVLADAGIAPDAVDALIMGNALGAGGNPARRVALAAGMGQVSGLSLDSQCTSGLDAILMAQAMIASGQARVVIAGGVESHSRRPLRAHRILGGPPQPYEQARFTPWPDRDPDMSVAADNLARALGISRAEQDCFAVDSHAKALRVTLWPEIVPIAGQTRDPFARALTPALAARAKPIVNGITGSITAANTAVAADGAGFCLVVHPTIAAGRGFGFSGLSRGGDPELPGLAPVAAIRDLLDQAGLCETDLQAVELMEAYAAQAIACIRGAGLDAALINAKGGALARGHPIGASGAVLAVRLFHDLGAGPGLAAIAGAGGIGTALLMRR